MDTGQPQVKSMFLAVEFDSATKNLIAEKLYLPLPKSQIRREKKHNFHLTLGFIRDIKFDDRPTVIKAFENLKELAPFTIKAESTVNLGTSGNILCIHMGPTDKLTEISQLAAMLLAENTDYKFDESYATYIPHVKIQTIKRRVPDEIKPEIREMFDNIDLHKLSFKVTDLALMQRVKYNYVTVKSYKFKAN